MKNKLTLVLVIVNLVLLLTNIILCSFLYLRVAHQEKQTSEIIEVLNSWELVK